ncbi:SDR family oxidoreductase [Nocardiopsis akebiae]|uniref:SDR family oxidoreductase n=1 Tax=Nocardiopsis akebiae TaxID=2831968 RepID=A0ABX8C112_9ACTN|nr:SDR family oxidoreductase [Nocardiopsis akebiae]QUX28084.1 SDR family oxidoreductase [Nocardiopsis akebiae]
MSGTERRAALVTGGSRGIGRAVAERLAADGQDVAIVYAGDTAAAEAAVAAVTDAGGGAVALRADVADEDAVRAAFDAVEERFGGVDVVVNSAGIMVLDTVAELDLADLDRMHRTNIRGAFVVNQQAARRVRRGGAIINLSTSVGRLALPSYAAYAASKGAVDAISPVLAKEMRGRDVTVNAVAPGPTATDLFLADKSDERVERLAGLNPFGRLGAPDDIAEVVSFLAGPGRWVNGQTLYANGGMV